MVIRSEILSREPWLWHGFSTREVDLADSRPRQRAFGREVTGGIPAPVVVLKQVHGDLIWRDAKVKQVGDGHCTDRPGRLLGIRTADCCPILIADVRRHVVAAVHAGWRGTLARVAEKAVGELRAAFGSRPEDLRAAIGPSNRGCCYEVGDEVRESFRSQFAYADELFVEADDDPVRNRYPMLFMTGAPPGHPYDPRWNPAAKLRLDVAEANRRQLVDAGLSQAAVEISQYCTQCCPDLFFSHRRGESGRMLSLIGKSRKPLAMDKELD